MVFGNTDPLKGLVDGARLHHLLSYESYDSKNQLFYNKDSTGFVLVGNPIAGVSLDDQGQAAQFFRQANCLPEGSSLQFLMFASPYINNLMNYWIEPRIGKVLEGVSKKRVDFLQQKALSDSADLLIRDYRVLISYVVPGIHGDLESIKVLKRTRKELQGMLDSLNMKTNIVDAPGLIHELSHIINMGNESGYHPTSWNQHDSISRQILDHDISIMVHDDHLHFTKTDRISKSYVPKSSPDYWALGAMDKFFGDLLNSSHKIACPFFMHYGLYVEQGQSKAKGKNLAKRETLENASKGNMAKWIPNLQDQMNECVQVCEQFQLGERSVITGLSFTIMTDPDHLDAVEQSITKIWRDIGWDFQSAKGDHLALILGSFPMTWTLGENKSLLSNKVYGFGKSLLDMGKAKKTMTKEVQNMLPIVAEWKGQPTPGLPLIGRRGQLFFWSPFGTAFLPNAKNAQTNHNYNVCIAGQAGSGKSVFMNEMVSNVIGVGGRVFVLDFGRSFKKTCGLFGGDHVEFDVRLDVSLNPFSKITEGFSLEDVKDRDEMLATIKPIIQVMASPKQGTDDLQNAFIDQAIHYAWEKEQSKATIDTIINFLLNHKKKEAQNLGETLFTFSSKGSYGHFFNRPSTINFSNKLVVIETDDLRNHPHLMAVVVQLLILHINQLMAKGDRVTPFLIVIDEAWKLLSGKDSAAFISEATRTARKYKGSIVLGTQHLTDYFKPESPAATEAFNCSAWKCILYQEPDVVKSLSKHPHLNYFTDSEFKEDLMTSIHSKPPHYSEVIIYGPNVNGAVGRLCLDPYTRLLYSTNPEEYQAIENLIKSGATIDEAVEIVAATQQPDQNVIPMKASKDRANGISNAA